MFSASGHICGYVLFTFGFVKISKVLKSPLSATKLPKSDIENVINLNYNHLQKWISFGHNSNVAVSFIIHSALTK